MPTPIVIGNWKMKLSGEQALDLAKKIRHSKHKDIDVAVCPSFVSLAAVARALEDTNVKLGAQDMFWQDNGAFTGEISPLQLKELGCEYVIIGHSERRQNIGETDTMVNQKVKAALGQQLIPIMCIGENMDQRRERSHEQFIISQLTAGLAEINLEEDQQLIIAYEPIWAIGTGKIDPQEVGHMQKVIKHSLLDLVDPALANSNVRIIYGGSVDGTNVATLTSLDGISGVLPGTASWTADGFLAIVQNITT